MSLKYEPASEPQVEMLERALDQARGGEMKAYQVRKLSSSVWGLNL